MLSKNKLKQLATYRQQKNCEAENLFVIEGEKLLSEALSNQVQLIAICALDEWLLAQSAPIPETTELFEVSYPELERLSLLKTPNKVWALARRPLQPALPPMTDSLIIALDHLQDPGNLGTIIRTADWFGIRTIVCSPDTVSCFNPKVVQSTMGSLFRTHLFYTNLPSWLNTCNRPVYGALLGGNNLYETQLQQPAVLAIGNEPKGLSQAVRQCVTQSIAIPNIGQTCESLNASVATAILINEFFSRH